MAAPRPGTAWTSLDGRRHDLGAYKHDAQAGLATDLASLLQAHILARDGSGAAPQPKLSVLPPASLADLLEREDWAELCGSTSLEQAVQLLAESRLAEQLYYDLFSVETSEDEDMEEADQEAEQPQQPAQQQTAQQQQQQQQQQQAQQQAQQQQQQQQQQVEQNGGQGPGKPVRDGPTEDASMAGQQTSLADGRGASIESIEDGELVGAQLPSGMLAEQAAPAAQPSKAERADTQAGPATGGAPPAVPALAVPAAEAAAAAQDVEMEAEGGFEAEDAAAALQHLAGLTSAAWQDGASGGEESEGEGGWAPGRKRPRAVRAPFRGPPERKQRKQRPAKLWCRYPLDESRWALILSSSAISSRQISLPWTQPGDMACELLGTAWVETVRRRTQSGTVRETAALLLEGDDGERPISYALYQNTGASQKETRPQYLEKLHPVLQSRAAAVGDVLLLLPMGPGRLHAQLVKSDSEEARAVHAAMSFDVPGEQQAWQSKHPSRQPSRASSQHDLTQLEASPGTAAAAGAAELALMRVAPSPPPAVQAAEERQPSPGPHLAAHRQEHVSPAGKPVTASAYQQALEQAAAADALEEMMPHHKRPRWEHPLDGSPPPAAASAAASAAAAPSAPGLEVHRKPSGLSALLQHPAPMAHPPLPPAQQAQLRQAVMQQQMQQQIARVSAAQRHAQALNKPGGVQRPPAAAGVIDTMAMGQTQLAMLQQYRSRLKEGSKEYEECSAHIAALQASVQHLSKFAKPTAPAAAAAPPQPAAGPPTAARPPASASLQQQMHQKAPAPRPQPPPHRPPVVPVLPKPAVPPPARPPGQPPAAMRQVQVMVAGRPMPMLVPAGMEGRIMQDMARMRALMAGQPQQAAAMVAAMQQAAAAAAAAAAPRPAQPAGAGAAPPAQDGKPAMGAAAAPASTAPAGGSPAAPVHPASQPIRPSSPGSQQAPQPHPAVSTPPPKPAAAPPVPPAAVQLARPAANAPVVMMSKPLLIRSTTMPPAAPAPPPKPAQQAQQPAAAAVAVAPSAPRPSVPAPAQAPAVQQANAPGASQAQPPAQPVPDASVSLAHMQAALHSFAAGVAVRVPPGEEQRQHVNERLHALAGELDALLKGFWQQQGPK